MVNQEDFSPMKKYIGPNVSPCMRMFLWYLKTSKNLGQHLTQKNKTFWNYQCGDSAWNLSILIVFFLLISLQFYYLNLGVTFYLVWEFYYQVDANIKTLSCCYLSILLPLSNTGVAKPLPGGKNCLPRHL